MANNLNICIARQFGSGGREVGMALAKQMDIPFYDKELLAHAAEKSGIMQELFEKSDERPAGGFASMMAGDGKAASYADYMTYVPNDRMQNALADVIHEVAGNSSCVIIGRCADYVLRGKPGVVSVFVHAPLEARIKRICRMHNLDEDAARALIRKTDRIRANYYSYYTDRDWSKADNYDLVLDSTRLGIEKSAEIIACAAPKFLPG